VSVQPASDGGYIAALGFTFGILKLGPDGAVEWSKTYSDGIDGFGFAQSVRETLDGGFVLAGGTTILKLDATGATEWQRTYGGEGGFGFRAIWLVPGGGYVVAGSTQSVDDVERVWVVKVSSTGEVLWQRAYDAGRAWSIVTTGDGGYAVAAGYGYFEGILVLRLDGDGLAIWGNVIKTKAEARTIRETSDGGFIVGGHISSGSSARDVILKLDASGNVQWRKSYVVHRYWPMLDGAVQPTSDGGYFLATTFTTTSKAGAGAEDLALLRLDDVSQHLGDAPSILALAGRIYKTVNGIKLPHLVTRGANGEITEEWIVKNYRVNPNFRANTFTQ